MNGPQHKFANVCTGIFLTATTYLIFQREDLMFAAAAAPTSGGNTKEVLENESF